MIDETHSVKTSEESFSQQYELPHLGRIFFARLFDVIVAAIPSIILTFLYLVNSWVGALIVTCVGLGVNLLYFVILPYFLKGNTFGKLIFGIKLIRLDKKITFWILLQREVYYLFIPMIILLIAQTTSTIVFIFMIKNDTITPETIKTTTTLIQNLGYLIYVIWHCYICITIYLQKEHQSSIDYKFQILCIRKIEIKTEFEQKQETEKPKFHIHLEEKKPGIIDIEEMLKDLKDTERENDE